MVPQDVEWKSEGTTVRAHLYLPSGEGPHPVVVADSADSRQFLPDDVYSTDSIHGGGERRAGRGG